MNYSPELIICLQFLLVFSISVATVHSQECASEGAVCDTHLLCPQWKKEGKCKSDTELMQKSCPASCYMPAPLTQTTEEEIIAQTAQYGVEQEAAGDRKEQTMEVILQSVEYMKKLNTGMIRMSKCTNKHEFCSFWAADGAWKVYCWWKVPTFFFVSVSSDLTDYYSIDVNYQQASVKRTLHG